MFAVVLDTLLNMNPLKYCSTYKYFYEYEASNLHNNIMHCFKLSNTISENFNHHIHNLLCISIIQCMEVQQIGNCNVPCVLFLGCICTLLNLYLQQTLLVARSNEGYFVRLEISSLIPLEMVVLSLEWFTDFIHTHQCKHFCMHVSAELLLQVKCCQFLFLEKITHSFIVRELDVVLYKSMVKRFMVGIAFLTSSIVG